jgi:hypothetical protein
MQRRDFEPKVRAKAAGDAAWMKLRETTKKK